MAGVTLSAASIESNGVVVEGLDACPVSLALLIQVCIGYQSLEPARAQLSH